MSQVDPRVHSGLRSAAQMEEPFPKPLLLAFVPCPLLTEGQTQMFSPLNMLTENAIPLPSQTCDVFTKPRNSNILSWSKSPYKKPRLWALLSNSVQSLGRSKSLEGWIHMLACGVRWSPQSSVWPLGLLLPGQYLLPEVPTSQSTWHSNSYGISYEHTHFTALFLLWGFGMHLYGSCKC